MKRDELTRDEARRLAEAEARIEAALNDLRPFADLGVTVHELMGMQPAEVAALVAAVRTRKGKLI